jgi:hypothetical protein
VREEFSRTRESEEQRTWVSSVLASLLAKRWYGSFTIKVEDGLIKRIVTETSMIPPNFSEGRSGSR